MLVVGRDESSAYLTGDATFDGRSVISLVDQDPPSGGADTRGLLDRSDDDDRRGGAAEGVRRAARATPSRQVN